MKHRVINGLVILGAIAAFLSGFHFWQVVIAAGSAWLILRAGVLMLGGLARPIPEPLPSGEMRKIKINYRCEICGAELRMTAAPDEDPEPPRHCQDEMTLMVPVDEI